MPKYEETFYIEKKINVPAEKIWNIITQPAYSTNWHPFLSENTNVKGNWDSVGCEDFLKYNSGFVYERTIVKWIEGEGFDLYNTSNGKNPCTAIWRIKKIDENTCILRITGVVNFIEKLPFPIRWALLELKFKPVFSSYLVHVLDGIEYHAITGKKIKKNQFGTHKMFSPK